MTKTPEENQLIFSSIAKKYDRLNALLTLGIDRRWRKVAVGYYGLKAGDLILDLCSGTGKLLELECRTVGKETQVIGLDFNQDMIEVAKLKLKNALPEYKYKLIQGNALSLPFENNTFDYVSIALGLRNVGNNKGVLTEILRVLKPGGKVLCLELSKPQIPVLKNIFNFYLNHILPIIGYLGTKDKAAYHFLKDSVNGFITKEQLKMVFDEVGFKETGFKNLTGGIAALHYGMKPTPF